jgi:hypothetical protein
MGERLTVGLDGSCCGLLSAFALLALTLMPFRQAAGQETAATCSPGIGRIIALQGNVEIQRAGQKRWVAIKKLDTSLCADDRVRTDAQSRTVVALLPETMVRVDQNTIISLKQSNDEIEVEFSRFTEGTSNTQPGGGGYFITRFPKKFKVTTPHMNAAVEGTEFMVQLSPQATRLTVLEGKVSSQSVATGATQLVVAGQSISSGPAGAGTIETVIKPQDAVQWVLRYPPIIDQSDTSGISRAEQLLRLGSVNEALAAIDAELVANPSSSDAYALSSVVHVAKNDKDAALEAAKKATAYAVGNYRAWLAMSYAQQAGFELEAALESARKAQQLRDDSALAHARVSELLLSLGDAKGAEQAAQAAIAANPAESQAHSMLGFVHLARVDTTAARANFEAAISRDSFSSLPRLGLGLAEIRAGELVSGREQIEIAVALDPSSSLLRSYVGKAYYEENSKARDALAADQFVLAQKLDPADPTPWFYQAVLEFSRQRPAKALSDLKSSSDRNEDRAVYRSRQLLDADSAARNASQASVYNELGFHQLGVIAAAESLATDPGNGSAHRFLADVYASTPRYEIARASELLQAQMRQPLGSPPLQSQLANDVLFKSAFFGPSVVGLNEFNPLFIRDDLQFQLYGLAGDNDTFGGQAIVNGLNGPLSFSVSGLASDTDGYRANNDDSLRQYDGYVQAQIGAATGVQLELSDLDRESGDLVSVFDPEFFNPILRKKTDLETQRLGIRTVIDSNSDILVSILRQDRRERIDIPIPDSPFAAITDDESWKGEIQYQVVRSGFALVAGSTYLEGDSVLQLGDPDDLFDVPSEPRHFNGYAYLQLPALGWLPAFQLGSSYDDLKSDIGSQTEWNPKLGLMWTFAEGLTLRAAGFRVLKRQVNSDQGLEPTQLAGINQFYDDANGAVSEVGSFAADYVFGTKWSMGLQVIRRDISAPTFDQDGNLVFEPQREDVASGYMYWLPSEIVSVTFEPRYQEFEHGGRFESMRLTELPLSLRMFWPGGLRAGVTVVGVEQEGTFDGAAQEFRGQDRFWLLDATLAYRLPERIGTISFEGRNLLNEEFRFQEIEESVAPRYIPEAQYLLKVSLSF